MLITRQNIMAMAAPLTTPSTPPKNLLISPTILNVNNLFTYFANILATNNKIITRTKETITDNNFTTVGLIILSEML